MPSMEWNQFLKYAQAMIDETLQDEVFSTVQDAIALAVKMEVYSVYTPHVYSRRGVSRVSKGLGGGASQERKMIGVGTLQVTPSADPKKRDFPYGDLATAISEGYGDESLWDERPWMRPRPFIDVARKILEAGRARQALINGLKKRGIDAV